VLSDLVSASDDSDFSMAISVQTGGFVVSGLLISMTQYFRGVAALVRGATGGGADTEALDALASLFDNLAEAQQGRRERRLALLQDERAPVEPEDRVRPAYLHLQDARLIGPAGEITTIPFWRGRLDHLDAFWLGSLSTST